MIEVQGILLKYGADFKAKHHMSYEQLKAMNAIQKCRTAELGGHLDVCSSCGYSRPSYNSCRNRFCPKCQTFAKEKWIDNQKCDLLNVQYFRCIHRRCGSSHPLRSSSGQVNRPSATAKVNQRNKIIDVSKSVSHPNR